jgi:hypothetical protein
MHWRTWDAIVWTLSLVATIAAVTGAVLGMLQVRFTQRRLASPYLGWHAWHHWLGIVCMTFLLTWIFSGWLSMDHGRLFSTGRLTAGESAHFQSTARWNKLAAREIELLPRDAREIDWFVVDANIHRRERRGVDAQQLSLASQHPSRERAFLQPADLAAVVKKLAPNCAAAVPAQATDAYAISSSTPGAPVYRIVCGDTWFHVDGASGAPLEKLDASRRAYRWLYQALHTLDFPALRARESLRTTLVILLCALGFSFSVTAVVIGWRRIQRTSTARR